jgi:hypothetical protein
LLEHPPLAAALRSGVERQIEFKDGDGSGTILEGKVASMRIDGEPWHTAVFFTLQHADAWLAQESQQV